MKGRRSGKYEKYIGAYRDLRRGFYVENLEHHNFIPFIEEAFLDNDLYMVDKIAHKWKLSDQHIFNLAVEAVNLPTLDKYSEKLYMQTLQLERQNIDRIQDLIYWVIKKKINLEIKSNEMLCLILRLDDPQIYHFLHTNNINFNDSLIFYSLDGRDQIKYKPSFLAVATLYRCFNTIPHILNTIEPEYEVEYEHWDQRDVAKKVTRKFKRACPLIELCYISHHHNSTSDKKTYAQMIKTITTLYTLPQHWNSLTLSDNRMFGYKLSRCGKLVNKRMVYLLWLARQLKLPRLLVYQKIYSLLSGFD